MKALYIILIVVILLTVDFIVLLLPFSKKKVIRFLFGIIGILITNFLVYVILKKFNIVDFKFFLYVAVPTAVIPILVFLVKGNNSAATIEPNKKQIVLEHESGKIIYDNPYNGFLGYGGAEAGKTASIGKPLLKEYMRNNFAFFLYDAKESDYTKTAMLLKDKLEYPFPIYNIDFFEPEKSYRTNIFHPSAITDDALVPEFATTFFASQVKKDYKKGEWYDMALGMFKAIAWVFYKYFPEYCSLPHVCNFITQNSANSESLEWMIKHDSKAIGWAGAFLSSEDKTRSSIMTTVTGIIGNFSANENCCYVLSGNDFVYNPLDFENPKCISVSNHFIARETISPLVVLLFVTLAKQIRFGNKVPFVFFLDEATTFRIPDLESYPSELREYLVAFVMLTQSPSKIEKQHGKEDRASFESNLANQFYGWTADINAIDIYAKQFSKIDERTRSFTTGGGRKGKSTTTSTRKEVRFDGEFFGSLKPGQFVGKAKNANVKTFNTRFKPYKDGSISEMPLVRNLTKEDIAKEYAKIIIDVTEKIFKK